MEDSDDEEWFLETLPDLERATDWRVRRSDLRAAAARTGNSSSGPDGMPYAFLGGADWAVDAIFEVLRVVARQSGGGDPAAFGANFTTLNPKGDVSRVGDAVFGRVDRTRTFTICNTDARVFALGLNAPLSRACSELLSADQRGFLLGRSIAESVALCESGHGRGHSGKPRSCRMFLDFANAFPTLSRRWLRLVLRRMRIPEQLVRAILFLYEDLHTWVVFGGDIMARVDMKCGVKQGCPLSGYLFALCVDGLLRRASIVPRRRHRIFAYADDLATVLRHLFAEFGGLLALFVRWSRVARAFRSLKSRLWEEDPAARGIQVRGSAKYLGVELGPGANEEQWSIVEARLLPRAAEGFRSGTSLRTRARSFQVYVASMLSYKAQFAGRGLDFCTRFGGRYSESQELHGCVSARCSW